MHWVKLCPSQPEYSDEQLAHLSGARGWQAIPWARLGNAGRSLAPGGSCVSKRVKAPELLAARLNPAMVCEPGSPKLPIASYWPNQVLRHLHHPSAADPKRIRPLWLLLRPTALGFNHGPASAGTLVTAIWLALAPSWHRTPPAAGAFGRHSLAVLARRPPARHNQVSWAGEGGCGGCSANPRCRPAAGWLAGRSRRRSAAPGPGSARPRR